jgi:hypothetical protein
MPSRTVRLARLAEQIKAAAVAGVATDLGWRKVEVEARMDRGETSRGMSAGGVGEPRRCMYNLAPDFRAGIK